MAHSARPLLQITDIVKHFPGAKALDGVGFDVRAGEVHCLLGQNGAGKSTLIKVLAGAHQPNSGEIRWNDKVVTIDSPTAALEIGIATMYQELDVVDGLTVADNVYLGHELSRVGMLRYGEAHVRTRDILTRLGHPEIPTDREVGRLSAAGKQIVSMARALSRGAKILVMDEPSAMLDPEEVDNLFRVIESLKDEGVAVIYISHRLEEIRRIGNRITVLKDGKTVANGIEVAETPPADLIEMMTGRAVEKDFGGDGVKELGDVLVDVEDLALEGVFQNVSFNVHSGQIVGLAGLVGAGRSEIIETIYGARTSTRGTVKIKGKTMRRGSISQAISRGVGLAPEERKSQGLLIDEPVYRNITLSTFGRFAKGGFLDENTERKAARKEITSLHLSPSDPNRRIRTLSGGNQQKAMLARWLVHGCDILLLDEPTRGVDIGARVEIYSLIRQLARRGAAIIMVSSEIEEVLGLADQVLVVADGSIVHQGPADQIDEHGVLDLVTEGSTHE